MKSSPNRPPRPVFLFLLGLSGGLVGEALLFVHAHCARVESLLIEDFRIVAFMDRRSEEGRARVVEERLRALPGVEGVRFLSPEDSLAELGDRDPELVKSVALLGDNPLPGAFEVQVSPEQIADLPGLVKGVEAVSELGDIRYKPLQARAILQVRFYRRFLTLVMSLAAFLWLLGAAALLGLAAPGEVFAPAGSSRPWRDAAARAASSGAGTALGMAAALLFAYPASSSELLSAWPRVGLQLALLVGGALGGWMLSSRVDLRLKRAAMP